jgi:hypothetical protein
VLQALFLGALPVRFLGASSLGVFAIILVARFFCLAVRLLCLSQRRLIASLVVTRVMLVCHKALLLLSV